MTNRIEVKVPNIGDFDQVEVIEVAVKDKQTIEKEQSLITLETDKAALEVPSPHRGVVAQVVVKAGDKVKEGDIILQLEVAEESKDEPQQPPEPASSDQPAPTESKSISEATTSVAVSDQTLTLPDLGTEDEVLVIEWSVNPGDALDVDQSVLSLETDKASMDVPSQVKGTLKEQLVKVGDKVKSGQAVAIIAAQSQGTAEAKSPSPETNNHQANPSEQTKQATPQTQTTPQAQTTPQTHIATTGFVHAGPGVRRLAHQLGVDLAKVKGTGHKGRLQYEDVHQYVKQSLQQGGGSSPSIEPMPEIDFSQWGDIEVTPLNRIKKITAKNLHRNWVNIPHVTQFDEADISEMEQFRNDNKASAKAMGFGLTPLSFIIKAIVSSLQAFPQFNSSLDAGGNDLILKKYFHIGVAVDTPNGLVVPVVRDVDQKGLFAIAKELNELGQKARDGKLTRNEMQGSCFSVSSLGSIGGTSFTPIINAPDVAILGVSKAQMKPIYDGEGFIPKLMLPISLSYDHRVIDGAEAARFCRHLCTQLEDIRKLLL